MKIERAYDVCCYECAELFEEINIIELNQEDIYLCDDCLKELNNKTKYKGDKNDRIKSYNSNE